jgi:hypothetical protein
MTERRIFGTGANPEHTTAPQGQLVHTIAIAFTSTADVTTDELVERIHRGLGETMWDRGYISAEAQAPVIARHRPCCMEHRDPIRCLVCHQEWPCPEAGR